MGALRTSSYLIPVKLESEEDKYMLVHGYTGAMDIVSLNILEKIKTVSIANTFSSEMEQKLLKRGYITEKTQDEEYAYVARIAKALQQRDKILYKTFTLAVTYNCNFRCSYCFENRSIKDSSHSITFNNNYVDKVYNAIDTIEPNNRLRSNIITLFGGEPLLAENRDIVEYIVMKGHERGFKFSAITNGYELEYFLDLLVPQYINSLQITVDGIKDSHNEKRQHYQNKNTFDKIVSNISQILPLGCDITVRVNVDSKNILDYKKLESYFTSLGLYKYKNFHIYSALIADNDSISIDEKKNLDFISENKYVKNYINDDLAITCNRYKNLFEMVYEALKKQKPLALKATYCGAQSGEYVFSPLGEIYPCWEVIGNSQYVIGSYVNLPIKWDVDLFNEWKHKNVTSYSKCRCCKFALFCGGKCLGLKNEHCVYFQSLFHKAVNNAFMYYNKSIN